MKPASNAKRIAAALERIAAALEKQSFDPVIPGAWPFSNVREGPPCPLCGGTGITTAPDNPVRVYCNCQLGKDLKRADEAGHSFGYGT
jgi:hypothetical protein